jgi:hypothetical protein
VGDGANSFQRPEYILSSGLFLASQILMRPVEITSPYVSPSLLKIEDWVYGAPAVAQVKKSPGVFTVSEPVLIQYADKLVEVARILKENSYDVILCPLRGARMPGLQAELVGNSDAFRAFDGADMGAGLNEERILDDLRRLIFEKEPKSHPRKIAVLDTARGGDSCRELARLLGEVNGEREESWLVDFDLIHADERRPPRAYQAYCYQSERVRIAIFHHPVRSLLIEDEPELLGYEVSRAGGHSQIVPLKKDGQILVTTKDKAVLYTRAPLDETMIALVSKEIMERIQQMPDIRPLNLDVWGPSV